ncbi:MAG: magnesium transporter [Candidatus Cloacimonetes bacterium]|nr:magnesium transporter [Candidatus Cloacimonadota bacterium]MCF7814328.1 magnesium transporter [Candidatus Cloacimonadota bacterium]MCF7868980.1 magnesium transporter [Candidatus Cloacimonadota bacterium]MCF7884374.1 magnesium transporter [Candidatus Cloacimonadota bacterium]
MINMTLDQILDFFENENSEKLRSNLNQMRPEDIASVINHLPADYQIPAFSLLETEIASEVLPDLHDEILDEILESIKQNRLIEIMDEMDSDEATDLAAELDEDQLKEVLEKIDKEDSDEIRELLVYDEDSAGGLMQKEIISVLLNMKRDEMIEYIRENHEDVENFHYLFVTDEDEKLKGILEVTRLLLAKKNDRAQDIMEKDIISVPVNMDQEQVAHMFRKYDIYILPVVDANDVLLGRITVDDIIDVIDEEASEDAYKMVGLESEDRVFTKPINSVKKRLPWLTLNLFTALLVSSVVGIFEETIANLSILAVLMPIVAGLGGNSGTQTLTVIVRGIALGELTMRNAGKAIFKEVSVGLINGVLIGSAAMLIAYFLKGNIMLGAVLGIAMVCNMFIAGLVGSLIPVILKSLKVDPALSSSIIITMLTDIGGFASFLGLASIFL